MRPRGELKESNLKILYYYVLLTFIGIVNVKLGKGNLLHKVGAKKFKPPESYCRSNYRYLHQRLLFIVS